MICRDQSILIGEVVEQLRTLPAGHFHTCVTSPPYWGLRDYGTGTWEGGDPACDHVRNHRVQGKTGQRADRTHTEQAVYTGKCGKCGAVRVDRQIGLEPTPAAFIERMVGVFREVWRVLRDDGTLWMNMGDSYASQPKSRTKQQASEKTGLGGGLGTQFANLKQQNKVTGGLKCKDLAGMPWRLALALQDDGWYLRQDIIWAKPNPMPESVTDRCTKAHEYIFLLTKKPRYYYDADAIRERGVKPEMSPEQYEKQKARGRQGGSWYPTELTDAGHKCSHTKLTETGGGFTPPGGRNARSVWSIATQPYPEAHFATFPEALPERCIKAGTSARGCCPECGAPWNRVVEKERTFESGSGRAGNMPVGKNGSDLQGGGETLDIRRGPMLHTTTTGWEPGCACTKPALIRAGAGSDLPFKPIPCRVLDPFAGSGTTLAVAGLLGCAGVGVELNPEYAKLAEQRIAKTLNPSTHRTDTPADSPLFVGGVS